MRRPGVAAFLAQELEITFLESLYDEKFVVIPSVIVFFKELGERLETCPLN